MASQICLDLGPLVTSTMAVFRSLVFGSVTGELVEDLSEAMDETVAEESLLRLILDEELRCRSAWCFPLHLQQVNVERHWLLYARKFEQWLFSLTVLSFRATS